MFQFIFLLFLFTVYCTISKTPIMIPAVFKLNWQQKQLASMVFPFHLSFLSVVPSSVEVFFARFHVRWKLRSNVCSVHCQCISSWTKETLIVKEEDEATVIFVLSARKGWTLFQCYISRRIIEKNFCFSLIGKEEMRWKWRQTVFQFEGRFRK